MDEEYLNTMGGVDPGTVDWNAEFGSDPTLLDPFANVMSDAVNSTGAVATPVTPKTSGLADLFHSLVVAPSGGTQTGSTVGNILNYFSQSLVQKPTNQAQAITAQGVNRVVYGSGSIGGSLFSNPLLWVGILAVIILVVVLLRKR